MRYRFESFRLTLPSRKVIHHLTWFAGLLLILVLLQGCFGKVDRVVTNYYVLDYQKNGENLAFRQTKNNGKLLEILGSQVVKTYDRNQIVVRENFYRVRYLQNDVWATKLKDAIPNLIAQRLRAYNIFGQVSRGEVMDKNPSYFLETNILNIERIEGTDPKAYLRMEFVLRDSTGQKILLTHTSERYSDLVDVSMVSLVQSFNSLIMEETNVFAIKCNLYFSGKPVFEKRPQGEISKLENQLYENIEKSAAQESYGELLVSTKTATEEQIRYQIEGLDSLNSVISSQEWEMNQTITLKAGKYRVLIGNEGEIVIPVEIISRQRSVLKPKWGELQVVILDESKTRVRMGYDIWVRDNDEQGYVVYNSGMFSVGDDEIGSVDKLWILPPGAYLVKLGGGSWSDLRNFATVPLVAGDRKTLTMVVDPNADTNILVGAGVFANDDLGYGSKKIHKGAIHGNISLSSNNNVEKNKPSTSVIVAGQLDNSLDLRDQIKPFHFTMRSIYDLGLNISSDKDVSFNLDDYSLKSVLLLYPLESKPYLRNFAFYGRANQSTHFFDKTTFFANNKNYILKDTQGNATDHQLNQSDLKTQVPFYPLRMKEGTGITYRFNIGSNTWLSLRGGYGWQQDYNTDSYTYHGETTEDSVAYDIYQEDPNRFSKGVESTVILSAINLLKFLSINSTLDVLFPMGTTENTYWLENENRVNIRLYRNISMDVKVNLEYDKAKKPWLVYDYSSFLQISLFY